MEKDIRATEGYYSFQKKQWVILRIFWVFMGFTVVVAALGLFGKGLLSNKTYMTNGIQIEYSKYMRVQKGSEIIIHVKDLGKNGSISFNNNYIRKVMIEQIIPTPVTEEIKAGRIIYTFAAVQNGFITFYLKPMKKGPQKLEITFNGQTYRFDQYIYF